MRTLLTYVNDRAERAYRYEELTREFREHKSGEFQGLVQEALQSGVDLGVQPLADSLAGLKRLTAAGYEVHIASSRKENLHDLTRDWLVRHGYQPYVTDIHPRFSNQKGTEFKRKIAERIKPVAAFDDTYKVATVLASVCPTVYLVDSPWNREPGLPKAVVRVPSFAAGVERFLSNGPPAPRA